MKYLKPFTILICLLLFGSCSSDNEEDMGPSNGDITYKANIKPIIDARCIQCHKNPPVNNAPMSLLTYQNVKNSVSNQGLIGQVESGAMPPSGSNLTTAQVKAIKDWQSGGFKEE